jgi:hypothetical protein
MCASPIHAIQLLIDSVWPCWQGFPVPEMEWRSVEMAWRFRVYRFLWQHPKLRCLFETSADRSRWALDDWSTPCGDVMARLLHQYGIQVWMAEDVRRVVARVALAPLHCA